MATENHVVYDSYEAAAAIGTAFLIVYVDSAGKVDLAAAATTQPIGIAQGTAPAGGAVQVAVAGRSKLSSNAALAIGNQIGASTDAQGAAITVAAGGTVYNYAVGRVVKASAAANGLAEVEIYPGGMPFLV